MDNNKPICPECGDRIYCKQVEVTTRIVDRLDEDDMEVGSVFKIDGCDIKHIMCGECDALWEDQDDYLLSCGIIKFDEDYLSQDCTAWVMSYPFTCLFCNDVENNNKIKKHFTETIKIMPADKSTYSFDAEADNCWIYFTTKEAALEFLDNLNKFLENRMAHWVEVNF